MARLSRALSVALAQPVPLSYNRAGRLTAAATAAGGAPCACNRAGTQPGMASGCGCDGFQRFLNLRFRGTTRADALRIVDAVRARMLCRAHRYDFS